MSAIRGSSGEADVARLRPQVQPREAWAAGSRTPRGLLAEEDVRFLLVHHTQTPNGERGKKVRARLRQVHDYHRSQKGWPDIAYNFLVDEEGTIWEGRAGSLTGPVRGDATGGSQGFAVLCCFLGDHSVVEPSSAARESMVQLLAWQAALNGVDLSAERQVRFTSRGSNRWPKGATVTTRPIAGHRDMSATQCPGEAAYALIDHHLWPEARARVLTASPALATTAPSESSPAAETIGPSIQAAATPAQPSAAPAARPGGASGDELGGWPLGASVAGLMTTGGLAWVISRRMRHGHSTSSALAEDG